MNFSTKLEESKTTGSLSGSPRSQLMVVWSVWKALFLREAVSRLAARRFAWFWLLLEPIFHVAYLMVLFATVRARVIGGINTELWIMVGMLAFFMFRNTGVLTQNAIRANTAIFVYRQVKPVDCVLVRGVLEGFLIVIVSSVLIAAGILIDVVSLPADPLAVLEAFAGLWLFGLGFGLVASVANELLPEIGKIIGLIMAPLYILSGVIFPIAKIPSPYRGYLMLNPIAHGLEAARLGFAPFYQAVPELNIAYLFYCALVSIFIGLALQVRYSSLLSAK